MKKKTIIIIITIFFLGGCTSPIDTNNIHTKRDIVESYNSNPRDVTIFMERHPCYGTCPSYYFIIFGNGESYLYDARSSYIGTAQVSQENILFLLNKFEEVNYLTLADKYDALVTDLPAVSTGISIGNESKHIYNYGGTGPSKLQELETDFDKVKDKVNFTEINLTKEVCDKMYSKTFYFLGKEWNTVQKDYCYYDVDN